MSNNFMYIPETDSWEPIDLAESGMPLTIEMVEKISEAAIQTVVSESTLEEQVGCEELAKNTPMPVGVLSATFDCTKLEWIVSDTMSVPDYYSSVDQEWPSWTQRENGRWYAPIDPEKKDFLQAWDEVDQSWYEITPEPIRETVSSANFQRFPSWILENDGLWHSPVSPPDNDSLYIWDEPALEWITIAQARERYPSAPGR